MPLILGTRLGPYEILAPLGAGGMGEVYRARDSRLGREVAVKVLPVHLSAQPEVRARFEREAKTISSLNHPHVCTLFDVGHEGGTDFLVMELVEGETLAARLTRGPMPAAEVLRLGAQIADALERAHRAGVVHRDLKPGNVMLTKTGAKLMDFGLARATGLATAPGSGSRGATLTHSPTVAAPLTAEGTLIGTFQYMSPEQLEGREADERSDLWALGCVLHEMVTGRPAFDGRSQASLISAIMSSEPRPVSAVTPLAPAGLDRLVRTCLTKDPDERARSAHDIKLQLLGLMEHAAPGAGPVTDVRRGRAALLGWVVAGIATIAALAMAAVLATRDRGAGGPVHVSVEPGPRQQLVHYAGSVAISPDGRFLAYCATDSSGATGLWLRRFDSPSATLLLPMGAWTGRAASVFWSPDSRTVGIVGNLRRLITVPVDGGSPTEVCATDAGRGATWSPRGIIVFAASTQSPLYRVVATGGEPVQVTWPDTTRNESGHRFPCFLPDGEHFLYTVMPPGPDGYEIRAGSLGSRETRKVMTAQSSVTYAAPGYLLFRRADKLVAQRFDARTLKLVGDPESLVEAPPKTDLDSEPIATASLDGRLVVLGNPPPDTQLGWLDLSGALRGSLSLPSGAWGRPVLRSDDRYAVVTNGDDLWRIDLARSAPLRLTSGGGYHKDPVWSPDGTEIASSAGGRGREEIEIHRFDGLGEPRVLPTTSDLFKSATDWSRAGLVLAVIRSRTVTDLLLAPYPEGGARPIVASEFGEGGGRVSPDGHWIAYVSSEGGNNDVYLQSFPEAGHKVRVSTDGASAVWWMPAGDELLYRTASGRHMRSVKLTRRGEGLEVGTSSPVFAFPADVLWADVSHDGQRVLVTYTRPGAQARRLRAILGWTEMMKR